MAEQTLDRFQADDDPAYTTAEVTQQQLLSIHEEHGLEAMIHRAELIAMENTFLDGQRVDTRLFRQGPEDLFETLAHQLIDEPNPFWRVEDGGPLPSTLEDEIKPAEPGRWELTQRSAVSPEGEALGVVLYMLHYPPDFVDVRDPGTQGNSEQFRAKILEVGHFEDRRLAQKFATEFSSFVMPGFLEGPELAVEAAKLDGLSGQWQQVGGEELANFMNDQKAVVLAQPDWQIHDQPSAYNHEPQFHYPHGEIDF